MSRKRWMWVGGVALAAIVLASAGWALKDQIDYAQIATGYAAKQTCSCLHVSGRTLDSCTADFPPDARDAITVTRSALGQAILTLGRAARRIVNAAVGRRGRRRVPYATTRKRLPQWKCDGEVGGKAEDNGSSL